MAIYSLANRTTATSPATPTLEVRTAATDRPRVMELGISQVTAVAGGYGLGRPGAIGVTPTSPVTVLPEDPGDSAGTVTTALAWGTGPTLPVNFFRRVTCPATIGAGIVWIFPRGLVIAASNSIVVWIIATAPVCDIWVVVDE